MAATMRPAVSLLRQEEAEGQACAGSSGARGREKMQYLRAPMRRAPKLRAVALLAALAVGAACRQGGPSPEYRAALAEHAKLVNALSDAAYLDPKMAALEASLAKVPESSDDHFGAQALLAKIRSERARVEQEQAHLKTAVRADARAPVPDVRSPGFAARPLAAPAAPRPSGASAPLGVAAPLPSGSAPSGSPTRYYCQWQGSKRANETACRNDSDCGGGTCEGGRCVKGGTRAAYTVAEVGGSQWSGCYAANAESMAQAQRDCEASARAKSAENVSCSCSTNPGGAGGCK